MHDDSGHHFGDRPLHQLIVMGHHLTGSEGKGPKKTNFVTIPNIFSFSTTGKELKSCFSNDASRSCMVVWRVPVVTARVMY